MKRGTTYNVLTALLEKGIAQEFVRGNVKQFVCSSPSKLLGTLDHRISSITALSQKLQEVLPELEQIRSPNVSSPKVRFFQGIEGIKEAMEELLMMGESLEGEKEIRAVYDLEENWTKVGGVTYPWVTRFIERRVELGIWYYGIVNRWDLDDYVVRDQAAQLRELRLAEGMPFPSEMMICGSRVVMISAVRERMGIIIDSEGIALTLAGIHALAWSSLRSGADSSVEHEETLTNADRRRQAG